MGHVPHLVIAAPWEGPDLQLSIMQWRHLSKVLRASQGDQVTYTDGLGTIGEGRLGNQVLERGEESVRERGNEVVVAVAPPSSKDRQRYLVEKLAELGVAKLIWFSTRHGKQRVASPTKVFSWVVMAVEQSQGAWLMETGPEMASWPELPTPYVVAAPGGSPNVPPARTVVIGPEGGFATDEVPAEAPTWSLGSTILRVETAAVVAAARLLTPV